MRRRRRWPRYISVGERRAKARKKAESLVKKGKDLHPVVIEGRKIARTFWGEAWCRHLESFSDYENRLPRGRSYARNGSVIHLEMAQGRIEALVSGTRLYTVEISIDTLEKKKWAAVKKRCAGKIGSLLELLQGKLSKNVMAVVTDRREGLFPLPGEIRFSCSCPDWAYMCKHVAAVLYGVGARLDESPELLFLLRGVDKEELISAEVEVDRVGPKGKKGRKRIAGDALSDVFGIEIAEEDGGAGKGETGESGRGKGKKKKVAAKSRQKASSRAKAGGKSGSGRSGRSGPVTGKQVAALREKFGMSKSRFALLLGVSPATVANWEKKKGPLNLQARTLKAWKETKGLSKRKARERTELPGFSDFP